MKIGFIGLPKSGKTTLFNALTGSTAAVSAFSTGRVGPNLASVKVGDERVTRLAAIYNPKRTIFPTIDIVDLAGVSEGDARSDAFSGDMMKLVRNCDALAVVLRGFKSDIQGEPDPLGDLKKLEDELVIADLMIAEKRLEKIELGFKKGQTTPALKAEETLMRRILEELNAGRPLRGMQFDENEEVMLRCYQFLSRKQALVILNSHEALFGHNAGTLEKIGATYRVIEFAGEFEMELSLLDEESAKAFMEDMGLKESARDRLTGLAYDALGYISFFTVGPDEVRAWNIRRDSTAVEAAAAIHTDLARGFIAAECFRCEDLLEAGSEKGVKDNGKFQVTGKDYIVKDGDILNIRFNV